MKKNPTAADLGVPGIKDSIFSERARVFSYWLANAHPTVDMAWSMATDLLPERTWLVNKNNIVMNIGMLIAEDADGSRTLWATAPIHHGRPDPVETPELEEVAPADLPCPEPEAKPAPEPEAIAAATAPEPEPEPAPAPKKPAAKKRRTKKKGGD